MAEPSQDFWQAVWLAKAATGVSWRQEVPSLSMQMLACIRSGGTRLIDVGGGASTLADAMLGAGWQVTVADIASAALEQSKQRLGTRAGGIEWVVADVLRDSLGGPYDVWHDRAVFHFLTEAAQRAAYLTALVKSLKPGGHVLMATFASDGPEKCSGLPTCRYDAPGLEAILGPEFRLVRQQRESHATPWGAVQEFQYALFERQSNRLASS